VRFVTGSQDAVTLVALMSFNDEALRLSADYPAHRITAVRHGTRGMRYVVARAHVGAGGPFLFVTDSADEVRRVLGPSQAGGET
jgi:hypothetical protein